MNNYEIIYSYIPYILMEIKKRAENHEKEIYHEVRELNGLPKTRISSKNETWKQELRDMLSIKGYQLTIDDISNDMPTLYREVSNLLISGGYTNDIFTDIGVKNLMRAIQNKKFDNSTKILTKQQLDGLKKELEVTLKRFMWARDLDSTSIVFNTYGFDRGAYSEGKMDIVIKLPAVKNKRAVRSEVKNYTEIFKIGTLGQNYISKILDSMWYSIDQNNKEIIFHLSGRIIEECCNDYLKDKYKDWFPMIEDGTNLLLFSDFIENIAGVNGKYSLQLRNYGQPILKPIPLKNSDYAMNLAQIAEEGKKHKNVARNISIKMNKYSLWYGKKQ